MPQQYNKRMTKEQTVLLDEDLVQAAETRARTENILLADAIERSLWLWLQQKPESDAGPQVLTLWPRLSPEFRELILAFWAYASFPRQGAAEEVFRAGIVDELKAFRDTPECKAGLERLFTRQQQ
jgi:hypothetical protein